MTVRELIEELENYDDDQEVIIGMQQNYGSDFAYTIPSGGVAELPVTDWDRDKSDMVVLMMGRQFGIVDFDGEDD